MTSHWLLSLGVSLTLTVLIELLFARICGKRGRTLVFVILVNVLTNPVVVCTMLIWHALNLGGETAAIAVLECMAVLVEGFVYKKSGEPFARPYLFSLAANAVSYTIGLWISII